MKHRCPYLKGRVKNHIECWQTTKNLHRAECTRCLLAYIIGALYSSLGPASHQKLKAKEA